MSRRTDNFHDQSRDPYRDGLTGLQRLAFGVILGLLLAAGSMLLQGCGTRPEWHEPPQISCEPLPLCQVPNKATSTQLDAALWACVLEYRALYSSCANRRPNARP